ncbi:MAG TPA: SPOR domain-containing protein [Bryobacteraceae bacterium]|nr:SPOR domain-containing protein [Bryobacteraceae bacterium]
MLRIPSLNQEAPAKPATIEETFAQAAEKRRRLIYLAIPGSIGLGLLLAILYVGVRVVSARRHAPPQAPVKQAAVVVPTVNAPPAVLPPPVEKPAAKVEKKPKPSSSAPLVLITPRTGETYLQLAALSPQSTLKYLDELRQDNLEPSVAPGPSPGLLRVVVGPFPDSASLARAKEHLNASKLEWIIRSY